jgi:hypothetical protein
MAMRLATWLGTATSLVGLVLALRPPGTPLTATQGALLALVALGFAVLVLLDIRDHLRSRRHVLKREEQIVQYMYDWIAKGGRAAIFTNDMSWARDNRIVELLHRKARNDELTVCLPRRIPLVEGLANSGARVFTYEQLDYTARSRFTIVNYGRMDAQLAVGRRVRDRHVIEEYSLGEHPVFAIASDLVELVKRISPQSEHWD